MKAKFRRLACVCLTAVMTASFASGTALALIQSHKNKLADTLDRYDTVNFENVTGKVDLSDIQLKNLAGAQEVDYTKLVSGKKSVIVTLNRQSVIESKGESESITHYLNTFTGAMTLKNISDNQSEFLDQLSRKGVNYTLLTTYNTVMNGVALELDVSDIKTLKNLPQVESVVFSDTYAYPKSEELSSGNAQTNPSNVYQTGIYDSSAYLETYGDGSGMKIAVLDTGLDYTHEAFNKMPKNPDFSREDIAELMKDGTFTAQTSSAAKGATITADDVYINEKVPFAYDYADKDTDVYPSYSQHGVHVAGIIAGKADSYVDKNGNVPTVDGTKDGDPIPFRGVAPEAQLIICKIFTDDFDDPELGGAKSEDIIAALEDCANLGVDVINMSIGTTSGFGSVEIDGDTEGEQMNVIYGRLKEQGISVIAAAGNEFSSGYGSVFGTNRATNPDSGTVGSPSTFDGALSVASINGQKSRYMLANGSPIFYLESSDENSVQYNFCEQMLSQKVLGNKYQNGITSFKFKYVVIPGVGNAANYSSKIISELSDKSEGPVIAVVKRGTNTFKDKVQIAQRNNADAIIVVNNVAGSIRMSLGDLKNPIPAVSVDMDMGAELTKVGEGKTGYIEVNSSYEAGPFMNDYSGWGASPDLKLKPEITSHGGEITSTVAGGYAEMSGTSMATPNLAGFVALVRSNLVKNNPALKNDPVALTKLVNQLVMSTATTVYDMSGLAYSPRKQGAGLATLENVFTTKAYLSTETAEDNRPKIELGDDKDKKGVYELEFMVNNFGGSELKFKTQSLFMTEEISRDKLSVAEKAHMLNGSPKWTVKNGENGSAVSVSESGEITVPANESRIIHVTLTLSKAEKDYIDNSFANGMYVEGFLKLVSQTDGQCDLNIPFMGFYGDWDQAPLLDYNAFEITEFKKDASYTDETRPQAQVWATQAYGSYYNKKYYLPLGSFMYNQDENADQIYTEEEHIAVSRYNDFYGDESTKNYMTVTGIKALYAGLLRNAELITCELYNADTGEAIELYDDEGQPKNRVYRTGKAYVNGGSTIPALVSLDISPEELGLTANGKYKLVFHFYRQAEDENDPDKQNNVFEMSFYVDYEAPVLVDSRIRYEDYKDGNKEKQRVYLDLDIFDNHYAQSVILCYADGTNSEGSVELNLANEYITPIYNSVKNGINTVALDITDIYEKYNSRLYVQLDDYALNHNVYQISFSQAKASSLPNSFEFAEDSRITANDKGGYEITIGVNEAYKLKLDYEGSANVSNFNWESRPESIVKIKNNEIFGVKEGTATVTVTSGNVSKTLTVRVVDKGLTLSTPQLSFGVIRTASDGIQKAQGSVKVNAGQTFKLEIESDPWYYPVETLDLVWTSLNTNVATVNQNGEVTVFDKEGTATIQVKIKRDGEVTAAGTSVMLNVQEPFTISNMTLTKYHGSGGDIIIPNNKNIMTIGEDAFKDNDNITSVVIPKTVTQISARAFKNCTALERVYFICEGTPVDENGNPSAELANLSNIFRNAFEGCVNLKYVDFTNVKTITLDKNVFLGCSSLEKVDGMAKIGTMGDNAFKGCSSLLKADITGLHTAGNSVFEGCSSLGEVKTDYYTQIGVEMFKNCTSLGSVEINNALVADNAFEGCSTLRSVSFGSGLSESYRGREISFRIGAQAFLNCTLLSEVELNGYPLTSIGDRAFEGCKALTKLTVSNADVSLGASIFMGSQAKIELPSEVYESYDGAIYRGTTLVLAPKTITSAFSIREGTTEIGAFAFSDCAVSGNMTELVIPSSVNKIGEGAFAFFAIDKVVLPEGITEIADFTFYDSAIKGITVPASVTRIGESAFEHNGLLAKVEFKSNSALKEIGDNAFLHDISLTEITLPDGAAAMGNTVFAGCTSLKTVVLPSLTSLGESTFLQCIALEEVTFGANATASGKFTFFTGYVLNDNGDFIIDASTGMPAVYNSSLKSVTLGSGMKVLGESVFFNCINLTTIDLKNITDIGAQAFAECGNLETVTGLENVEHFGYGAFAECEKLPSLILTSAKTIEAMAFYVSGNGTHYSKVELPVVEKIGEAAFHGGWELSISLPASVEYVGAGAFAASPRLASVSVDEKNENYFSENGVLYRSFKNELTGKTVYELMAYPSLKPTDKYEVKEGTVSIANYAFAFLSGEVKHVVLPYSVKIIGHAAFFGSKIGEFTFNSITAPTLAIEYYDIPMQATDGTNVKYYALFYLNFIDNFMGHLEDFASNPIISTVKINYPTNGTGYDNYIYSNYFGAKVLLGELPLDVTRELIEMIKSFFSPEEIAKWSAWEVNEANKKIVSSFAETVKQAHLIYNNISKSEVQTGYLNGAESKLFAVEAALKPVKTKFGIASFVKKAYVSPESAHKKQYFVGEKFDMTGLVLIVEFDDYSTEIADMSQVTLDPAYDRELTELDVEVRLTCYGKTVLVGITVTEGEPDNNGSKLNPAVIYGPILGVLGLAAIAAAVVIILKKKKGGKKEQAEEALLKGVQGSETEQETNENATADETEPANSEDNAENNATAEDNAEKSGSEAETAKENNEPEESNSFNGESDS